tara:strand:+ start:116897 stop:118642 length:1746 start_codon:yes stop_codon:yes gene_type:complete
MNNSRTIETVRSSDLVTFKILIEGTELSAVHQVKNISVEKEINRIPFAQVVFLDGEAASQNFNLSNEDLLVPGKDIEIKAGYHNDEETIFKGIIIKHSIKIRENNSVLIVECRDEAVKMTIGRKSNFYYESKDSDIIEEIIGKYSLENEIEYTSFINKEMVQYRASDWDFIMTRAQLNGQICTVDDGKIKISKPDLSQAEIETVAFGSTLLDFDAEMDARNQFNSITAYGWNPSEQEIIDAEANDPGISLNGNISVSDLAEVINLENLELKHGGNYNSTQLQNWSDAKNLFQQLSKTRGRVKFQGIPTVKPGTMLKLEGVGVRFNGKIFISSVRHEIVNGNWTVDAEFGMNPKWFSETYDVSELPAAGIIPAVSGLQVGVVSQLESDPDGEDRILVKIPIIDKDEQGIWTRIATLDAGNNRGSFFLPEIGDEVIVGFVNDDPNHAVILGMLHSSAKPAPLTASDDNHEKGFVTRSELKLIFNDEKKSIIIETPGGKKVTIDEDAGVIKIEDDNRNIITMGNGGIAMESGKDFSIKATGDCNIEAMNVNVKANAQFKAQGNAGAEVSTSAIAVLKGSLVQIN